MYLFKLEMSVWSQESSLQRVPSTPALTLCQNCSTAIVPDSVNTSSIARTPIQQIERTDSSLLFQVHHISQFGYYSPSASSNTSLDPREVPQINPSFSSSQSSVVDSSGVSIGAETFNQTRSPIITSCCEINKENNSSFKSTCVSQRPSEIIERKLQSQEHDEAQISSDDVCPSETSGEPESREVEQENRISRLRSESITDYSESYFSFNNDSIFA